MRVLFDQGTPSPLRRADACRRDRPRARVVDVAKRSIASGGGGCRFRRDDHHRSEPPVSAEFEAIFMVFERNDAQLYSFYFPNGPSRRSPSFKRHKE